MSFAGKVALVTGGALGIGRAAAQLLQERGATVHVGDIAPLAGIKLDVTSEADWRAVTAAVPKLDILIHCAGISAASPIEETPLEEWRRVMQVNLDGAFLALRHLLPLLATNPDGGAVVMIGSASGTKAAAGAAAYSCSKAALRMLVKCAALEAKARNVRVNMVSPAGVATSMWKSMKFFQDLAAQPGGEAEAWKALGGIDPETNPLHRMAFPAEIAEAILFLAGDASRGMTGAELVVDAGYTL